MLFEIHHRTHYRYSTAVFFEPLVVRLRPRCDPTQFLHRYDMQIQPPPAGISPCIDLAGNSSDTVWFEGEHSELLITTSVRVETMRVDPFHFLITDPQALTLPFTYADSLQQALRPYLEREADDMQVRQFSRALQEQAGHKTVDFLSLLARTISSADSFQYLIREQGDAWSAGDTLSAKRGACRDFAVLYIDACRCAGLAARFVSGYGYTDAQTTHHLHAWAEVYLPGAGWRAYDPSQGLLVSDRHIALAAGRSAQDASPTFGSYRGSALPSMTSALSIRHCQDSPARA